MLKFLTEILPLIAFFVGYKMGGIMAATLYMLVASIIAIIFTYVIERQVNKVNLMSAGLLLVSGSLTLFSGNSMFIKMKATALYLIFASIFFYTNNKATPAIKFILGHVITLKEDKKWPILNKRFMVFFIIMAIANEIVWRNFSEEAWVSFKVFGVLPITILFSLAQVPFIMANSD
jgi:intracellular septation protein